MFLRASSITQVSLLCLMGFLLSYLWFTARKNQIEKDHPTWPFSRALAAGILVVLASTLADYFESWEGDLAVYFRGTFAVYFYYQICVFLYSLPPATSTNRQEMRDFSRWVRPLILAEVVYLIYRAALLWPNGAYIARQIWGEIPVISLVLWTTVLSIRRLLAAERAENAGIASTRSVAKRTGYFRLFLRSLIRPRSNVARIYRWFTVACLVLIVVVFFFTLLPYRALPLWVDIGLDGALTVGVTLIVLVYLRYQLVPISLELRVLGAGLTVFLLMVHVLSWGISLTYLAQELPGVPYAQVFGSAQQPDFVIPAPYRTTAHQLGELLLTLIWFQVGGSLLFLAASAIYYRRTIIDALTELLVGFEQAEHGNLAYRIPRLAWQDEFSRIATAFNSMAQALQTSSQEVQRYQEELERLVEERTAALGEEIALRKDRELQQAIQDERARISRETHDGLLQTLAGVRMRLNRGRRLSQENPEVIQAEMAELAQEVTGAGQELRRLINELNTEILSEGVISSLQRIVERHQHNYRIPIHTEFAYTPGRLSLEQELNLLRILQEGLANACRHSRAAEIWVDVELLPTAEGRWRLNGRVRDNGAGFDPDEASSGGRGLDNLQRRAAEMGGELRVSSRIGEGTSVEVYLEAGRENGLKPALLPGRPHNL